VRYCDEVKKKNAVSFFDNGAVRQIKFVPEVAKNECWDCQECFALCPISYAQAAYLLTEALAFPGQLKIATLRGCMKTHRRRVAQHIGVATSRR
jgi:Fe-S-cluster-containing hydrogenase component 2